MMHTDYTEGLIMRTRYPILTLIVLSTVLCVALVLSACADSSTPGQEATPTPSGVYPYPYGTP